MTLLTLLTLYSAINKWVEPKKEDVMPSQSHISDQLLLLLQDLYTEVTYTHSHVLLTSP